jgi:hypothetical protein
MFLLLSMMPMMVVNERSRPMRDWFSTMTHRRRSSNGAHSLLGCVLDVRDNRFHKTLFNLLRPSFGFIFCKLNTWHSNCSN